MYLGVSLGVEGLQRTMDYKFIPFGTNIHGIVNPLPHDRFPCSNKALLNPCFWVDFGGQVDQSLNNPTRPSSWSSWHLPIHVLQQHQLRPINKLKDNTTIFIQYEYIYNSWKTHIPYTVYHTCILNFTWKKSQQKTCCYQQTVTFPCSPFAHIPWVHRFRRFSLKLRPRYPSLIGNIRALKRPMSSKAVAWGLGWAGVWWDPGPPLLWW